MSAERDVKCARCGVMTPRSCKHCGYLNDPPDYAPLPPAPSDGLVEITPKYLRELAWANKARYPEGVRIFEAAASRITELEAEREEARNFLAGTDIASLPNDMPLVKIAYKLMEDRYKFMWQVRDTCARAEKAEAERDAAASRIIELEAERERLRQKEKPALDEAEKRGFERGRNETLAKFDRVPYPEPDANG